MNRTSPVVHPGQKYVFFGLAALTVLLLTICSMPSVAQKAAPAGWRFEIEEGKSHASNVGIRNICKEPHRFRIKTDINYLKFAEPTNDILVAPASTKQIGIVFDATGLKIRQYNDKVVVECLDCKKEKICHQDRDELAVDMTVIKPIQNLEDSQIEIGTYDRATGKVTSFREDLLNRKFEDGGQVKDIWIEKQSKKFYLLRRGFTANSNSVSRIELIDSGRGSLYVPANATKTVIVESCSGCAYCSFVSGGGCECKPLPGALYPDGACIHTITKTTTSSLMAPGNVASPDDRISAPRDVIETRLSSEQLERVTNDEKFKAALEVVAEQNEVVDLESARLVTSPSAPGLSEIDFRVTVKGTNKPGEYARLAYLEETGKPPVVFFDEKRTGSVAASATKQQSNSAKGKSLLGCLFVPWGPWNVVSTYCSGDFWCLFKKHQALFLTETRTRKCPNGTVQGQIRTVKVHCGC